MTISKDATDDQCHFQTQQLAKVLFLPFFMRASTEGNRFKPPKGHREEALHGYKKILRC
jgi:hypothetical protein